MIEDIAESFIKGIGRAIAYIFGQLIFEFLFYYIGWPFVKIITLGKYPKGKKAYGWHIESREGIWVSFVGLIIFSVAMVLVFTKYNAT